MRRIIAYLFIPFLLLTACSVSHDPQREQFKRLQRNQVQDDTSVVYSLPYEAGRRVLVVQGYYSRYTHRNRVAIDFKMPVGTKVLAAREGVVVSIKQDGTKGGWKKEYRSEGNHVIIRHADSTFAGYWHLQHNGVVVKPGDSVRRHQLLGRSGRTGYALFPHLHFFTWRMGSDNRRIPLASRFKTKHGNRYLRPFRRYRYAE